MAFGAQIWSDNNHQWVDVVQPSWVLDMVINAVGNGSRNYGVDTNRFRVYYIIQNYFVRSRKPTPTITVKTVNASTVNVAWTNGDDLTFLVIMEAK